MATSVINGKMLYCPKCQQTYEEGSQRFCNNDGGRLLPVSNAEKSAGKPRGVFTNLLSRSVPNKERDEKLASIPRFVRAEPEAEPIPAFEAPVESQLFQSDPDEIELELEPAATVEEEIELELEPEPAAAPPALKQETEPEPSASFETEEGEDEFESDPRPMGRTVRPDEIPSGRAALGDRQFAPVGRDALTWDNPEVMLGQTVKGRYHIAELAAEDDTGFSYLAEDRLVANKKVLVRVLMDEDYSDDFTNRIYAEERIAFSHVNHPNVVGIIDSGELQEGKSFVITEYVEGNSVKSLLETTGQFNVLRTARMIRQSSYALSEMHQNGVLHRNLTPANIILTLSDNDTEQVKITGFGIVGNMREEELVYKAYEVIDGQVATAASDVYSLAVIAYQMLTNRVPFSGTTPRQMMKSQREGMLLNPTNLRLDVSPLVDQILQKGMALVGVDRYPKARDFGDALFNALTTVSPWTSEADEGEEVELISSEAETADNIPTPPAPLFLDPDTTLETEDAGTEAAPEAEKIETQAEPTAEVAAAEDDPAWTKRSPEPPKEASPSWVLLSLLGFVILLAGIWAVWTYFLNQPVNPAYVPPNDNASQPDGAPREPISPNPDQSSLPPSENGEVPPPARAIPQPPDTTFFQSAKQNLKGDLARNFVGFSLFYPSDWKVNETGESTAAGTRGKFLDISRNAPNGKLAEQMLISYYESRGTFNADEEKFPQLVAETNETLKKLIPDYQMLSQGRILVNGGWPAYEVKFQGGGTTDKGEKLIVWGRRLFVPAARPGVKNGFEITMLATSYAPDVKSVDDVGNKGGLSMVLSTFEPGRSF
jgi:serine/threonine-protein kinase